MAAFELHPAQRRFLAEDLMRLRRSDEQRRYASPQRAARIDANPHQVDAVIFALARIREGGCILADEVGLGKTIEAGLVVAQMLAEGARRVLLIAPKPLLGQWGQELFQLFGITAREGAPRPGGFDGDGVFLIGREAAGSEHGGSALMSAEPFDLCIIDEAHEVFAGIYKRFDRFGTYQDDAPAARTAGRVRDLLLASRTPVLLLTATPIQNTLTELWGLIQYVDPLGTLLGDLPTFREVFCNADDRHLIPGQEQELRSRISVVLKRTLRRQAQDFLEKPFVGREARLFPYTMSPAERELYQDVTRYLLEPGIQAFAGSHRQLLLLGFHRRLASSTRALAASLERVASRLRAMLARGHERGLDDEDARTFAVDLEDEEALEGAATTAPVAVPADSEKLKGELVRVEGYVRRAEALVDDSKFRALLQALEFVRSRADRGLGAGKLVIFTESLVTQDYLHDRLVESRLVADSEITLLRGANTSKRALQALERWRREVPQDDAIQPSLEIATRLALVHEFRTAPRGVFISTEAGAKGLNLQFCDTIVNYDLPWNPQRIEQRIGRCHRYGQQRGVTVINFLASDNEAQTLTFEILSQKLELFGTVLDASDHVLHRSESSGGDALASALGGDFEGELRRIYERSRSLDEVAAELRALRDKVADERRRFEETRQRTAALIEERLDGGLQRIFRSHRETVPLALAELDRDLLQVVLGYLDSNGILYEQTRQPEGDILTVSASEQLPEALRDGLAVAVGASKERTSLHVGHPLVAAAVADARSTPAAMAAEVLLADDVPAELVRLRGHRVHLRLVKVTFDGFEQVQLLVPVAVPEDTGEPLDAGLARALLESSMRERTPAQKSRLEDDALDDGVEAVLFAMQSQVDDAEQARFERAARQAERFVEDRVLVLKKRRLHIVERLEAAEMRREGAMSSAARTEAEQVVARLREQLAGVDSDVQRLEKRDDDTFRRFQEHIHQRRYTPPRVERVFDLDLVIA